MAGTAWVLIPLIGFLVVYARGGPWIQSEFDDDLAKVAPRPDDPDYARRYAQFVALGFRPAGFVRQHARFFSPIRWVWRSLQGSRWLTSADGRTVLTFFRLIPDEPVRFAATLCQDGGLVRTSSPGMPIAVPPGLAYRRADVGVVEPVDLLARHDLEVAAFCRERNSQPRPATMREVIAAEGPLERILVRRSCSNLLSVPLALFVLPATGILAGFGRARHGWLAPLGICIMAAFFAAVRAATLGPARRRAAKELRAGIGVVGDVDADGRILDTGGAERVLRALAAVLALVTAAWTCRLAVALLGMPSLKAVYTGALAGVTGMAAAGLAVRATGRVPERYRRDPTALWIMTVAALAVLAGVTQALSRSVASLSFLGTAAAAVLAGLGARLERKRRYRNSQR